MKSLLILGRQPALGLAELESLYGAAKVQTIGGKSAIVDVDPCLLAFDRLGGSVKFCKILTTLDTTSWKEIEKFLIQVSPGHSEQMPEGKMRLGLSAIDMDVPAKQLEATALSLKKVIKKTGRNVRVIPNKSLELNAAQVLHNQLTGETGWELYFIRNGKQTIIAQTVKVQDIAAYTRRDRERPKRDTKVGMLPPKLAQIIINLAAGQLPEEKLQNICDIPAGQPIPRRLLGQTVLDPFCGTGVVLQEALLMGYDVRGSDKDKRMVEYSEKNLLWLEDIYDLDLEKNLEVGDATQHKWPPFDFIASEIYLGQPFNFLSLPTNEVLENSISECNSLLKEFLKNVYEQVESGTRLCLAVPAWQTKPNEFKKLPLIDQIENLGYNRVDLEHAGEQDLIYYRPDQVVARQLLVITRN